MYHKIATNQPENMRIENESVVIAMKVIEILMRAIFVEEQELKL